MALHARSGDANVLARIGRRELEDLVPRRAAEARGELDDALADEEIVAVAGVLEPPLHHQERGLGRDAGEHLERRRLHRAMLPRLSELDARALREVVIGRREHEAGEAADERERLGASRPAARPHRELDDALDLHLRGGPSKRTRTRMTASAISTSTSYLNTMTVLRSLSAAMLSRFGRPLSSTARSASSFYRLGTVSSRYDAMTSFASSGFCSIAADSSTMRCSRCAARSSCATAKSSRPPTPCLVANLLRPRDLLRARTSRAECRYRFVAHGPSRPSVRHGTPPLAVDSGNDSSSDE